MSKPTNSVKSMRFHPGWTIDGPKLMVIDPEDGDEYEDWDTFKLWAPDGKRGHWSACWTPTVDNRNPADGFFVKGSTLDEVLTLFDRDDIRGYGEALRQAAQAHQESI